MAKIFKRVKRLIKLRTSMFVFIVDIDMKKENLSEKQRLWLIKFLTESNI